MPGEHKTKSEHKVRRVKLNRSENKVHRLARLCFVLAILSCLLITPALAQTPEKNGYVADKPLETYAHGTIKGDLFYTVGNSYYSGKLYPGDDEYTINHDVNLPKGATVKFARLYLYWTWSAEGVTGRYPEMKLNFNGEELKPEREYSDRKGWGIYDYPTGTWAYNVSSSINGSGTFNTKVENTGSDASYVCINGIGLLIVYTDPNGKDLEYWINEGSDELNSQVDENGNPLYYATSNQTICEMLRPILQLPVRNATLWTVFQSGNWMDNTLLVNDNKFSEITDGTPYPDLDIDTRDISEDLKSGENAILFQAAGDYVVPSGAFLVLEINPQTEGTQGDESSEKTENADQTKGSAGAKGKETPGFGFGFTLILLSGGKLVTGHRTQKMRK